MFNHTRSVSGLGLSVRSPLASKNKTLPFAGFTPAYLIVKYSPTLLPSLPVPIIALLSSVFKSLIMFLLMLATPPTVRANPPFSVFLITS